MSPQPFSPDGFKWFVTVLIVAAAIWALFDIVKLSKTRGKDGKSPLVKDERFGFYVGIVIGLFTISGVLKYHGVF